MPRLNTLMLWGLTAGGVLAPYRGVVLKNADPRLPFALSSSTLLAAAAGIVYVECRLQLRAPASVSSTPEISRRSPHRRRREWRLSFFAGERAQLVIQRRLAFAQQSGDA